MRKLILISLAALFFVFTFANLAPRVVSKYAFPNTESENNKFDESILKEGDVIFQTDNYGQSLAVQKATGSKYSHVGILFKENGQWYVYEAVQPVTKTQLTKFILKGDKGNITISRYKNSEVLTPENIETMKAFFKRVKGKDYDLLFEWSDDKWYCSELVWKMYNAIGVQISDYEKFGQFNFDDPFVQKIVNERFKNGINEEETVVTPKGIHESPEMVEVYTNY